MRPFSSIEIATGLATCGLEAQSETCRPGATLSFLRAASCSPSSWGTAGESNEKRISAAAQRMPAIVLWVLEAGKELHQVADLALGEALHEVLGHGRHSN